MRDDDSDPLNRMFYLGEATDDDPTILLTEDEIAEYELALENRLQKIRAARRVRDAGQPRAEHVDEPDIAPPDLKPQA
jgi:hypothetical protein